MLPSNINIVNRAETRCPISPLCLSLFSCVCPYSPRNEDFCFGFLPAILYRRIGIVKYIIGENCSGYFLGIFGTYLPKGTSFDILLREYARTIACYYTFVVMLSESRTKKKVPILPPLPYKYFHSGDEFH